LTSLLSKLFYAFQVINSNEEYFSDRICQLSVHDPMPIVPALPWSDDLLYVPYITMSGYYFILPFFMIKSLYGGI
jgi:hypothetical protein